MNSNLKQDLQSLNIPHQFSRIWLFCLFFWVPQNMTAFGVRQYFSTNPYYAHSTHGAALTKYACDIWWFSWFRITSGDFGIATKTPLNLPRVAHALVTLVSMFFPSPAGLSEWLMAFTDDCQVEDCSPDHFAQRTFILRSRWAITRQLETQFMKVRALVQHGKLW